MKILIDENMKTEKKLSELEKKLLRIIINSNPRRSPPGQVEAIMKLIKEELINFTNWK